MVAKCGYIPQKAQTSKLDGQAVEGKWVGYDEDSSGHWLYLLEKRTVSIQCSVKFDKGDVDHDVYLPHKAMLEEERKKSVKQVLGGVLSDKSVETEKGVDVLGENFEQSAEGHPKCATRRIESAAIKRLRTSEGVMSAKPSERGQMPKGVQSGFIEEVDDDEESATIATMVDIELNEVKLSYEEACTRSD